MQLFIRVTVSLVLAGLALLALHFLHDFGKIAEGVALFALLLLASFVNPAAPAAGSATAKPAGESKTKSKPRKSAKGKKTTGTVKWFNVSKGYGFINCEDGKEVFVHFRSIEGEGRRSLRDGQSVAFVVTQGDKGPQAEEVEPLD